MRKNLIFPFLLTLIFAPLAAVDYAHFPYSDGAEQAAAVRALTHNIYNPDDPVLNEDHESTRYVPSTLIIALFVKATGIDVIDSLKLFAVVCFLLFASAVILFSRQYFNDTGQPFYTLAALLFLWGTGWKGSNAYMYSALLYTAYFSSLVSFSVCLLALYFQLRFYSSGSARAYIAHVVLGGLAFINHPLTAVFYFMCSLLLCMERKRDSAGIGLYFVSVAAACAMMLLWPYYHFVPVFLNIATGREASNPDYVMSWNYLHTDPLKRIGPALAGVPVIVWFLVSRRYLLLTGGFCIFSALYAVGYAVGFSLSERFVFFSVFMLQVAFSRWVYERLRKDRRRPLAAYCMLALLAAGACIQTGLIWKELLVPAFYRPPGSFFPVYRDPNRAQKNLSRYLHAGDVVLSDVYSSWAVPAYTGAKIVAPLQTSPQMINVSGRIRDTRLFFDPATSYSERRAVLNTYGVTHVLVNIRISGIAFCRRMSKLGLTAVLNTNDYCLFTIDA